MKKLERKHVKIAAKFVVGSSAGYIFSQVVKNNVHPENKYDQVRTFVGSAVLGTMVADMAKDWTDTKIDKIADGIAEAKAEQAEKK